MAVKPDESREFPILSQHSKAEREGEDRGIIKRSVIVFHFAPQPHFATFPTLPRFHYVKQRAAIINAMIGDVTSVLHTNETGVMMTDVTTASERTGQTKWAQKYGRFYTLAVVRWLAHIFDEMTHMAGYAPGLESLFGHYEFFQTYTVDDSFLLTRKVWPL